MGISARSPKCCFYHAVPQTTALTRQLCSITFLIGLFGAIFCAQTQIHAADLDWKITGTSHVAFFPNTQRNSQNEVISFLQIKPDLALEHNQTWYVVLAPRLRLGLNDSEYTFISLDDVYGEYVAENFEVRLGYQTHFWGAVESFNIIDIFNQKDYRVDFFDPQENKIGEPATRVRTIFKDNVVDIYYLPYFTPANLPDKDNPYNPFAGRLNIDQDRFYTNTAERSRPQFAVRWERTLGTADVGLVYFNGYERFPVVNLEPTAGSADTLYYEVQQVSGDIQMTVGNWILKAEALYQNTGIAGSFQADSVLPNGSIVRRDLVPDNLGAFVGGVEYTLFRFLGEHDLGVLAEYLYNSQQDLKAVGFRPFQNDLFTAFRWARNNLGGGELLAGVIVDLKNGTQLWRFEYMERFFDHLNLQIYAEIINAAQSDPLQPFNKADNVTVQFSYAF